MTLRAPLVWAVLVTAALPVRAQDQAFRTFPQFVGSWVLDEGASTGRMRMAPLPARTLTIGTTPTGITVTRTLQLPPATGGGGFTATEAPAPEVYRLDGTPTLRYEGMYEYSYSFLLVADALALTQTTSHWVRRGDPQMSNRNAYTMVTDAYAVEGDVLTVHRQLTSVNGDGQIHTMREPANNLRQTYVYRRAQR